MLAKLGIDAVNVLGGDKRIQRHCLIGPGKHRIREQKSWRRGDIPRSERKSCSQSGNHPLWCRIKRTVLVYTVGIKIDGF